MASKKRVFSLKEVVDQFQNASGDEFDDNGYDVDDDLSDHDNLPLVLSGRQDNEPDDCKKCEISDNKLLLSLLLCLFTLK